MEDEDTLSGRAKLVMEAMLGTMAALGSCPLKCELNQADQPDSYLSEDLDPHPMLKRLETARPGGMGDDKLG